MSSIINRIKQIIKVKLWSRKQQSRDYNTNDMAGVGFIVLIAVFMGIIGLSMFFPITVENQPVPIATPTPQPTPIPNIDDEIASQITTMVQFLPLILILGMFITIISMVGRF